MAKNLIISILVVFFVSAIPPRAAAALKKAKPLIDGFVLSGVDGKLFGQDANERWFFEFDSDASDGIGRIYAGSDVELLPSAAMEKMTDDAKEHSGSSYRLWGRVTKYEGRNFIFPIYFLPLSKVKTPFGTVNRESDESRATSNEPRITINEPNDALAIPDEVIAKLTAKRIIRLEQLRRPPNEAEGVREPTKGLELKTDYILADRTGFISSCEENTQYEFVFDALGRNVQAVCLRLLPCQALERAQQVQSTEPDPLRFKIAGIVTEYKGRYYLLLQRAIRVYSHGNFNR